jgi:hypothetical protein
MARFVSLLSKEQHGNVFLTGLRFDLGKLEHAAASLASGGGEYEVCGQYHTERSDSRCSRRGRSPSQLLPFS